MTPTPAHSLLVTLAYSALIIMALFLIFFVVMPALEEFFERVAACTEHHSFGDCLLGFWASF
jgi:hypothetical protein